MTTLSLPTLPNRGLAAGAAAVPLLWLPLTLLHPTDFAEMAAEGRTTVWLFVHFAQLVLVPFLVLAMLLLLAPLLGIAGIVARVALVAWGVFFAAFDSLAGITSGVLAHAGYDEAAHYIYGHDFVGGTSLLGFVAHPLWGVAAVATALALRSAGAPLVTQAAMLCSLPFALTHVGPPATVAFAGLVIAFWTGLSMPVEDTRRSGFGDDRSS